MSLKKYLQNFSASDLQIIGPFFDESTMAVDVLKEPVVYVDAGVRFQIAVRGFSVGDGDSSRVPLDEKLETKKNFSDLAFVLQNIPSHFSEIHVLGFLGHRKDHEIMNLAEVHEFLKKASTWVQVYLDKKIKVLSAGTWNFVIHGNFSLFAFEEISLQLSGACDFPIFPPQSFSARSSHGLSNQGRGEIKIICNNPLFLYLNADE